MDTRKNMIILKGIIKTSEVKSCKYNKETQKIDVTFNNEKVYSYTYSNVEWLKKPQVLNPNMYHIYKDGKMFFDIKAIYVFHAASDECWHLCFSDGTEKDYFQSELNIFESCLTEIEAGNVFAYIKQIANLNDIKNEETGEKILAQRFSKMFFVGNDVALAKYLHPSFVQPENVEVQWTPIFPFGCNNSQYKAVKDAMENQISVIQGPPGTGKTQTILNIIANIVIQGKTVQIVSNNNSAITNVYEKLSLQKYNLGFIVARLGNSGNKKDFISRQDENYPDFSLWKSNENQEILLKNIHQKSIQLKDVFDKRERLAILKQEQAHLTIEIKYFEQYIKETNVKIERLKSWKRFSSKSWMDLWQECQMISESEQEIGIFFKIKGLLKYGIWGRDFYKQDFAKIITTFQAKYYRAMQKELAEKIAELEKDLQLVNPDLIDDLCNWSMILLKASLAKKYESKGKRVIFDEEDLWKKSLEVLEEYPVILSTTFSSRNSLSTDVVYDYLIMDEASQVDIATGALALSCARNVVIVGDTKQLPNVVTEDAKIRAKAIFDTFNIDAGYQFTKSFLQSVLDIMPNVAQTMLREHYRCHPKIINFCNQKFYKGELIIMTEDNGEKDVLAVVKTVPGNHVREHYSQRQIDVIKNEILPKYVTDIKNTGIITPYRNQVEALEREFQDIDIATVHKFQGKEKDAIIISTVDDEISDFADDPYLLNVAVSRAKKRLMLVVTGNEQTKERNITDLVSYIQYNNFEVTDSKIYSIFDYLYKQYTKERIIYLQKHKKVSDYNSENLMYALLEDLLSIDKYASLDIVCHFPMNMLIRNMVLLNNKERQYVMNPGTHIDFLLYNRINKKPVLVVEVDGYEYHKDGTIQNQRDTMKNRIMKLYGIPILRFKTNGSEEKKKIVETLDEILGN